MTYTDTADLRHRLDLLRLEHDLAFAVGLDADEAYMEDLERELATWEAAWTMAAVVDIATLRAELRGRPQG